MKSNETSTFGSHLNVYLLHQVYDGINIDIEGRSIEEQLLSVQSLKVNLKVCGKFNFKIISNFILFSY